MLSVRYDREINPFGQQNTQEIYLRVYLSMFKSGLVAKLGANNFTTLLTIASFMDEKGECYPTQKQLADRMGVHPNTINKYIKSLLEFELNGKPLVTREKVSRKYGGSSSLYRIQPLSQVAIFSGQVEEFDQNHKQLLKLNPKGLGKQEHNPMWHIQYQKPEPDTNKKYTADQVIGLFCHLYKEQYKVNYSNINFGRDKKLIKNKLLDNYTNEQIEQILNIVIREYDRRWKNEKYPRPTIGAVCSWLADQALAILDDQAGQSQKANELVDNSDEQMRRLLEKLG